ncbi:hypothetical protein LTR85_004245 [Meristemomyces frigidus]|nr:hypothetical protein LTR85_004245 [Meristemomyces frigidus]
MIVKLYASLERPQGTPYSHVALTLSILASIAGYWGLREADDTPFTSPSEASAVALYWLRSAFDVLEHIQRTTSPDLETVQTSVILLFLSYHIEGFSPNLRRLQATALANAKDIGLHLTDSTHNKRPEETQQQIIDTEMRRRVWWHLASTDWSLSLCGGPHEGTYYVQPRHMQVKKPRNVTDEDLEVESADFSRPESEATTTSYYLQRIRLAEVCREVADITWEIFAVRDPEQIAYEKILALDAKFAALLDDMPAVLRIDQEGQSTHPTVGTSHDQLVKQRYFTYLTIQARRSKLHLPFLVRVERDERYAFSREICLSSARKVLALRHVLPTDELHLGGHVRLLGVLHHFFCALVVLVMDVCVNKAAGSEEERKAEVQDAFRIFECARECPHSATSSTLLESLMAMLRKHKVRLGQYPRSMCELIAGTMSDGAGAADVEHLGYSETDSFNDFNFDELWQSYVEFGATAQSWEALLSDSGTVNGPV